MGFDKSKAMRNAEKFLAQGKIKAAISEYKQVVDNDPKDFVTMNLLGDLFAKTSETKSAITYYSMVADHYNKQGFAQKAIAVYNKISKIQPNSVHVSEKLAELYKTKGAVKEAKSHYVLLAESYEAKGRSVEALAMWKQIALLDPTNTEVCLNVAQACLREGQTDEAVEAFADAAARFLEAGMREPAEAAFKKALEHRSAHPRSLAGYNSMLFDAGRGGEAIKKLEALHGEFRSNGDILTALIDCHLRAGDTEKAERAAIKLVEIDPASYPKFIDLANHFLGIQRYDGATRMLNLASEHMLAGGRSFEFAAAVNEVLSAEPDNLEAARLLVRFCSWQKDEAALLASLRKLADLGKAAGAPEDERLALSQLVILVPQEASYAERLKEVNELLGFDEDLPAAKNAFDERFLKKRSGSDEGPTAGADVVAELIESSSGHVVSDAVEVGEAVGQSAPPPALDDESTADRRRREAESIRFYVDNGYYEIAEKAIEEFAADFGDVPEVAELRTYLSGIPADPAAVPGPPATEAKTIGLDDLRSELGLEESEPIDDSDFETKYSTAIAYQEMGLLEQAIAEFQDAAALVKPNDGTRRFFQCANLLGHCFMESGMPKLALRWFQRALEIADLNADEKQALWYELGAAHEAEGNYDDAGRFFEQVYAENVEYRDVRDKLKKIPVAV